MSQTSAAVAGHRRNSFGWMGPDVKKDGENPGPDGIDLQGVPMTYYQEMKEIFKIFDADGSGAIDPKEIREQMISLGFTVDNTTIYQLISDLDSDGSQKLEFDEFFGMLRDTLEIHTPSFNSRHNFLEIFDFLDDLDPKNRDGKIDASNLRRLANVLGDDIGDEEIKLMVKGADPDGKGHVLAEDFYQLMVGCASRMEQDDTQREDATSDASSEPATPRSQAAINQAKGRRSLQGGGGNENSRASRGSIKVRKSVTQTSVGSGRGDMQRQDSSEDNSPRHRKSKARNERASTGDWTRGSMSSSVERDRGSVTRNMNDVVAMFTAKAERKSLTIKRSEERV